MQCFGLNCHFIHGVPLPFYKKSQDTPLMLVAALFNSGLKNISLFEDIALVYIHLTR